MAQVAIITGGASGIGLALATALVQRGWHVVLGDIQAERAQREAERLTESGPGTAVAAAVDVRDQVALESLVHRIHEEQGRLDLMANNAGIGIGGEPEDLAPEHWDTILDINLRGVINGSQAAYPLLKAQGHGTILNVASLAGLLPQAGPMAAYATTKYGVVGYSLALRASGADHGVRVTALCPGWIDTPMLDGSIPAGLPVPPPLTGTRSLRETLVAMGQPIYPADRLAEEALAGLRKDPAVLVLPRHWHRYWLIGRILPGLALRQAEKLTRYLRRGSGRPIGAPTG